MMNFFIGSYDDYYMFVDVVEFINFEDFECVVEFGVCLIVRIVDVEVVLEFEFVVCE